ncbi:type I-C CRISPR-associated protein Cas8c/Csd1 [Solwaraspora sp. WMMD1047]|uniref:type I-C CRISPR-associated protein Cas8c/Csd1 n=1 Tax=Solwaraspora sp. WMMD1047 TaxID=3016102 RepID=UPI0024172A26|nr:type I-C CRISPR-associated protein Cas8c/Csd1 [Solwaraspora sp. WMMD1047]MDG4829473.1 type I-C CRISPR-associated protein Cas8c/Csd1 [Solwaraspora sp. WMMD1047]
MLLQRLVEFADSGGAEDGDEAPPFYAEKPVRWILDIGSDGAPTGRLRDTADKTDPQRRFGVRRTVPAITRTAGIAPTVAVDNIEYVFGWLDEGGKPDRVAKQHQAFRDLHHDWATRDPDGPGAAIVAFYEGKYDKRVAEPDGWARGDLVAFRVDNRFAFDTPSAASYWASVAEGRKGSGQSGRCLVCGRVQPLLKTIPQQVPQRWLPGATQGASLVSINESVHGYELQKFLTHTPICSDCGLKFMSALVTLLSDPEHSTTFSGQNARLAWWVVGGSQFNPMAVLDDPNEKRIQVMLGTPVDGARPAVDDLSTYCSVTVGGNVARVVVRDWVVMPLARVKENIGRWFDDHEIVDGWTGEVTLVRLLQLVRVAGRWQSGRGAEAGTWARFGASGEDRPPDTFKGLLGAALLGRPLPPKLLNHVVNRIRTDGRVDTARVALVRLALRRHPSYNARERLTPTLNDDNNAPAYVSGRIFAVLDDLQRTVFQVAKQPLNTTFAERYFGRAITNPQAVLVSGERTATAWLRRLRGPLRRPSWATAYQNRLDDLYSRLDSKANIPSGAVLPQKAEFILGYHQQRASMRAERIAAANNKAKTDLPPPLDEQQPAAEASEGDAE